MLTSILLFGIYIGERILISYIISANRQRRTNAMLSNCTVVGDEFMKSANVRLSIKLTQESARRGCGT